MADIKMTDEEMSDKYVIDTGNNDCTIEAFLAGLNAGRPKWHKVADGDLPESYMRVLNQDGEKVMYDYYCKSWRYDDADEDFCDTPIAWCEIPKFEE